MRSDRLRRFPIQGRTKRLVAPVAMRCKPSLHLPTGHQRGLRVTMKRALLVIDVQNEYFPGGQLPITHPHAHLDNILRVMDAATEAGLPVVVVQHTFMRPEKPFFKRGTPGWELHPEVASRPRDHWIETNLPGSFTGTGLEGWLRERGLDTVTIAGYMTHMCCDTTAPGGAPGPEGRVPLRRDGDTPGEELGRRGRRRGDAPRHPVRAADDDQRGPRGGSLAGAALRETTHARPAARPAADRPLLPPTRLGLRPARLPAGPRLPRRLRAQARRRAPRPRARGRLPQLAGHRGRAQPGGCRARAAARAGGRLRPVRGPHRRRRRTGAAGDAEGARDRLRGRPDVLLRRGADRVGTAVRARRRPGLLPGDSA